MTIKDLIESLQKYDEQLEVKGIIISVNNNLVSISVSRPENSNLPSDFILKVIKDIGKLDP